MHWKMSVDLSRPLVPSMGQHDPLDGLVTFAQLETMSRRQRAVPTPDLASAIADFAALVEATDLRTVDPLGLGGLLSDAWRVAQLGASGAFDAIRLLEDLLRAAVAGVSRYASHGQQSEPPSRRLAFRELGLSIGLLAVELIEVRPGADGRTMTPAREVEDLLVALESYSAFGRRISSFWLDPAHRTGTTWAEHRDINEVMLATEMPMRRARTAIGRTERPGAQVLLLRRRNCARSPSSSAPLARGIDRGEARTTSEEELVSGLQVWLARKCRRNGGRPPLGLFVSSEHTSEWRSRNVDE
jgi:hypothetical protein